MNAALLRCPLCGRTYRSLMRSLASGLPHCDPAGHRFVESSPLAANDNEPIERPCRLGAWKMRRCPFRSCELADACTVPTPANDNDPGGGPAGFFASLTPAQQQAALDYRGDDGVPP